MKGKAILSFKFLFIIFLGSMSLKGQLNENMIAERFNMNAFNPAYVWSEGRQVFFSTRSSWQGVTGAPKVNYFSYSGISNNKYGDYREAIKDYNEAIIISKDKEDNILRLILHVLSPPKDSSEIFK